MDHRAATATVAFQLEAIGDGGNGDGKTKGKTKKPDDDDDKGKGKDKSKGKKPLVFAALPTAVEYNAWKATFLQHCEESSVAAQPLLRCQTNGKGAVAPSGTATIHRCTMSANC